MTLLTSYFLDFYMPLNVLVTVILGQTTFNLQNEVIVL